MRVSDETHYKQGEKLLREAMELVPDEELFTQNYVEFCLQVAENCTLEENYIEAVGYFRKALKARPDDAETLMDLGAAYARNNEVTEAVEAWQKALALLNPKKGRDKQNIESILENVRIVQKAMEGRGME